MPRSRTRKAGISARSWGRRSRWCGSRRSAPRCSPTKPRRRKQRTGPGIRMMNDRPLILNDPQAQSFAVSRSTMVDPQILEIERRRIFDICWIYVGHDSEIRSPGDFKTRTVCGRPVIFCRDSRNGLRVFLNTCRHRGAMVCREPEGNAKIFSCFYHGWSYDRDGNLDGVPGEKDFPASFNRRDYGLKDTPRVETYRGFVFLNFDPDAMPLEDYLSGAKEYIDLVIFFFSSRRRHTILTCDWSSDVCSSD